MELSAQRYSTPIRILIYVGSFIIPLLGIVLFIVFLGRDQESKQVGRNALIAAIAGIVLGCVCGFAFGGLGVILGGSSPS